MTMTFQMVGMESLKNTYDDFARVDIHVGTIARAEPYPEAGNPAFKIWIDLDPEIGEKKLQPRLPNTIHLKLLSACKSPAWLIFHHVKLASLFQKYCCWGFPTTKMRL
jgi:tRNA-binding protein